MGPIDSWKMEMISVYASDFEDEEESDFETASEEELRDLLNA